MNKLNIKIVWFLLVQIFIAVNQCGAEVSLYEQKQANNHLSPSLVLPTNTFMQETFDFWVSSKRINDFFIKRNLGLFCNDKHVVLVLKCDGVYNIKKALEHVQKKFKILFMGKSNFSDDLLSTIYDEHKGKIFYPALKNYMSHSSILFVLEKKEEVTRPAWEELRYLVGIKWGTDKSSFRWDQEVVYYEGTKGSDEIRVYKIGKSTFLGEGTLGLTINE